MVVRHAMLIIRKLSVQIFKKLLKKFSSAANWHVAMPMPPFSQISDSDLHTLQDGRQKVGQPGNC